MNFKEAGLNDVTSLMEELSDEEAGACVGGLLSLGTDEDLVYVDGSLVGGVTGETVDVSLQVDLGLIELTADDDANGSFRVRSGTRSDRNLKENFSTVDVQDVLTKVATLPIETWNYKDQNPKIRHIGPMAQDFAAAFNVGEDHRFINTVDANGVALAAIQALYKLLQEKDAQISAMRTEIEALKQQIIGTKIPTSIVMPVAVF